MIPRLPQVEQIDFAKMELEKVSDSIDQYFTKAEMSAMCDYEKLRFRNMRKNYEMMLALGEYLFNYTYCNVRYIAIIFGYCAIYMYECLT